MSDEADDRYRRASGLDPSKPGEGVRRAVLEYAAQQAAEHARAEAAAKRKPLPARGVPRSRWRPVALFGTLAAAVVAGLMIAPRLLMSPVRQTSRLSEAAPTAGALSAPHAAAADRGGSLRSFTQEPPVPVGGEPAPAPSYQAVRPSVAASQGAAAESPRLASAAAPHAEMPAPPPSTAAAPGEDSRRRAAEADAVTVTGVTAAKSYPDAGVTAGRRAANAPPAPNTNVRDVAAAFRHAAETGDLGALDELLGHQSDINSRDPAGRTALMLATLHGQTRTVSALLAYGADPNAADAQGTTPLKAAMAADRPAIVAALQRYGAHP
jgi:hypothetical protein